MLPTDGKSSPVSAVEDHHSARWIAALEVTLFWAKLAVTLLHGNA